MPVRTQKCLLRPKPDQADGLSRLCTWHRHLANAAIAQRRDAYRNLGESVSYPEQSRHFLALRRENPDTLGLLNASSLQQTLRKTNRSFAAFFRRVKSGDKKPGFPRFKGADRFHSFEFTYGDGVKLRRNDRGRMRLYLQGVGEIRMCWHRDLPDGATVKHVVVKRSGGKWHAFLMYEMPETESVPRTGEIGIDVGLRNLVALSDGTVIPGPKYLDRSLAELRVRQRAVERKKKGSRNRADAKAAVARLHEHIANQRRDHLHKLTRRLVDSHGFIAIEDMKMAFMNTDRIYSRSSHDAALGTLRQLLEYKAEEAGTQVVAVGAAWTSQDCSVCGTRVPKDLSVRTHRCPACGLVLDRDVNAARVILQRGLEQFSKAAGQAVREPTWAASGPCVSREAVAL